jgi:predicted nucleic acid-binding protein
MRLALLDSNVVIASVAEAHEHHEASISLFLDRPNHSFAVAAHSYSEAYSILTRRSQSSPFRWPAADAIAALESVAAKCVLVGLTHAQTFDAVKSFAAEGGVGPRLYDRLIGEAALLNGLECIVTWNTSHMSSLFSKIRVLDPIEFRDFQAPSKSRRPRIRKE